MNANVFNTYKTAWCPGCGNFSLLKCLKTALEELSKSSKDILMVAGIGQAAKIPQYIEANSFCGLHGRALPVAAAAKIANERLTVIVSTGDGDSYGEGGNHLIHNIRRNTDITHFVHNNQIYGLTKGQASPTSDRGLVTGVQVSGNLNIPLNPMLLAIAAGAGFAARGYVGNPKQLISIMKQAISYKGYALVDILQPCVSFNKVNTYDYYNKRIYEIDFRHDTLNKLMAMEKAMEYGDKIPLGVFYNVPQKTYHEKNPVLNGKKPLLDNVIDTGVIKNLIKEFI